MTFIPGVGAKMENWAAFIEYHLQQTLTGGELSMLVTNLATNTEGDKTKIMSMMEGPNLQNITNNDRRFTIEKRGQPAGAIAWRVITATTRSTPSAASGRGAPSAPARHICWTSHMGRRPLQPANP